MPATTTTGDRPSVRIILAVGDAARERLLSRELAALGVTVAARCLDALSLAEHAGNDVDAALISADLHRLTPAALLPLQEHGIPAVVLIAEAADTEAYAERSRLVPSQASPASIAAAVIEAADRGVRYDAAAGPSAADESLEGERDGGRPSFGTVVGVTSGKGAPGKTTMAIALAACLSSNGLDVALMDADLRGGNIAPYLDLDPRRGLVGLRGDEGAQSEGAPALHELQEGTGFAVLAGLERPELGTALRPGALAEAIAVLAQRFQYVIADLGSYEGETQSPLQEAALGACGQLLLVTGADLVSLWNGQLALHAMRGRINGTALAAVVNRSEGREHYDGAEVARAFELPVLGVVREDRKAARRAIHRQVPLTAVRSRAARELRGVAKQLAAGLPERVAAGSRPDAAGTGARTPAVEQA